MALLTLPALRAEPGWVAETAHFRVIVPERPGVDAAVARIAAEDLEAIRTRALQEGLGSRRRADGPLEVLLVATMLELHSIIRDPPSSRTRGITIRGLDSDVAIVPWHELPGPQVTLAHEYAHQLEDPAWPLWFREGRAVHVARRTPLRSGADPMTGMLAKMGRLAWLDWADVLTAEAESPTAESELFQTQSWLLVHWLAATRTSLAGVGPEDATEALARMGKDSLTEALRAHLENLRASPGELPDPVDASPPDVDVRPVTQWEIPLFAAEASRELRLLDSAERSLAELADRFPGAARVQAAYASLCQMMGRHDEAERRFGLAVNLGDSRARTAYRYALLLMNPGPDTEARTARALRFSLHARDRMPGEPEHQLAVVQARMLREDWEGAFEELRILARFPSWRQQADREAREVDRRRLQAVQAVPAPPVVAEVPAQRVPVAIPRELQDPPASPPPTHPTVRRIWPPYGTWLQHGRVAWVDCSEDVKKVIVHTPYSRVVLRISRERPPRLINRPFRGDSLPCESRGWWAAFAYKKLPEESGFDGDLVGIRF